MDNIIDQAINEANEAAQAADEATKQPIQQASKEEQQKEPEQLESEVDKTEGEGAEEEQEVVFPKKAINAISRRDKKIAQRDARIRELEEQLNSVKQPAEPAKNQKPDADSYDSFDDYLEALVEWKAASKQEVQKPQAPQVTPEQVKEQIYYQQRATYVDNLDAELTTKLPDYEHLKEANADILTSFNVETVKAIYELDNAPLALYALAKEGKLEELANTNPAKAAIMLAKAEAKGEQYLQKKVSNAPAPIGGVRAKPNPNQRSLSTMTPEQLLEWARK